MFKNTKLDDNQKGFASIIIAIILIVVLSLLTVGFAQLARREQQDALNKQLANQAYYAAESAVNDLYSAVFKNHSITPQTLAAAGYTSGQCLPNNIGNIGGQGFIDNVNNNYGAGVTCAQLDLNPTGLSWNNIPNGESQSIVTNTGTTMNNITINWGSGIEDNPLHTATESPSSNFPASDTWNAGGATSGSQDGLPVLEVNIVPIGSDSGNPGNIDFTRQDLIESEYTAYLYPSSSANATDCSSSSNPCQYVATGNDQANMSAQAPILDANCSGTGSQPCSMTISGLGITNDDEYLIKVSPFYDNANVSISAVDTTNAPTSFTGQAVIDVTAKAHNVLKRFQAVIQANGSYPSQSIVAGDICKRMQTTPNFGTSFINTDDTEATSGPCDIAATN